MVRLALQGARTEVLGVVGVVAVLEEQTSSLERIRKQMR